MNNDYAIGRHGSFQLKYSWLTKGIMAIQESEGKSNISNIFTSDDATINLGVGKNMVSSIRYWLAATNVISNNKITNLGLVLFDKHTGFDPYLEDDASLWLLHIELAKNKKLATSIYWLFNHFHKNEFTAEEAGNAFYDYALKNNWRISEKTLKMDIQVILRMYAPHKSKKTQIEDMLESPLSLLGLLDYFDDKYHFSFSSKKDIPIEIIAYAINTIFSNKSIVPVKDLMYDDKLSLGAILKITEDSLTTYLENLANKYPNEYSLIEDAGIFQLYKSKTNDGLKYLRKYYEKD